MNKINSKQQAGFSPVEALLVLVIVAIIGLTGAYVFNAKKTADDSLSNASTSQPTIETIVKTTNSLEVPALRAKLVNIPDALKDLTFAVNYDDDQGAHVDFSTKRLTELDPKCAPDAAVSSIGFIGRGKGTYNAALDPFPKTRPFIKQLPENYLTYSHDESSSCSDNPETEKLHKEQVTAFKEFVHKPANLQAL